MGANRRNPFAIAFFLAVFMMSVAAQSYTPQWSYKKDSDDLTDEQYSIASGYDYDYKYNDDFKVSFRCVEGDVRFEIYVDTLIASKGDSFKFEYRVDKRDPKSIQMKTWLNDNKGGYALENAIDIAKEILGGNTMIVRAITWDNDYLNAKIKLAGSDSAIRTVFSDCNQNLDSTKRVENPTYSLKKFNESFSTLTPAQQAEVLSKLQDIMQKF